MKLNGKIKGALAAGAVALMLTTACGETAPAPTPELEYGFSCEMMLIAHCAFRPTGEQSQAHVLRERRGALRGSEPCDADGPRDGGEPVPAMRRGVG